MYIFNVFYKGNQEKLEPETGLEPVTDGLQNRCSTIEATLAKLKILLLKSNLILLLK